MRTMMTCRAAVLGWTLGALVWGPHPGVTADVAGGGGAAANLQVEYGISLALSGRVPAADSAFISVLSSSPGDPRALTNLGNLSLMRGDPGLALVFYGRASRGDTADAGILLNRSVALLLGGDFNGARFEARRALERSGDPRKAMALLGLRKAGRGQDADRGADQPVLTPEELTALLAAAADSIPADTLTAADSLGAPPGERPSRSRPPIWRSAGPRATERTGIGTLLYWKR